MDNDLVFHTLVVHTVVSRTLVDRMVVMVGNVVDMMVVEAGNEVLRLNKIKNKLTQSQFLNDQSGNFDTYHCRMHHNHVLEPDHHP